MNIDPAVLIGLGMIVVTVIVLGAIRRWRRQQILTSLLATFGQAVVQVQADPRALVAWASVATTARVLFPESFRELDAANGARFPFPGTVVEDVHARWTTQWLVWEREHDLEYKRQESRVEAELVRASTEDAPRLQRQLEAIEQEKLQRYQEHYEEYVRVGRAIGKLEV